MPATWERAHAALDAWLDENGYAVAGPSLEVYMHGFWDHRDPSGWQTDFEIMVVARGPAPASSDPP